MCIFSNHVYINDGPYMSSITYTFALILDKNGPWKIEMHDYSLYEIQEISSKNIP